MKRKVRVGIDVGETFTDVVVVDNETRKVISSLKIPKTQSATEGFAPGIVEAIDQIGNKGKPAEANKAETTGAEWLQTRLLRGKGATVQQLPINVALFTDMRCTSTGNADVIPMDANKGAEKIDIFGTPK